MWIDLYDGGDPLLNLSPRGAKKSRIGIFSRSKIWVHTAKSRLGLTRNLRQVKKMKKEFIRRVSHAST